MTSGRVSRLERGLFTAPGWVSPALACLAAAAGSGLVFLMPAVIRETVSFRYLIVASVLVAVTLPALAWFAGGDALLRRVMIWGLGLKLASAFVRLYVSAEVYGSLADAGGYDKTGRLVAQELTQGRFNPADMHFLTGGTGTQHLTYIVGWVYRIFGADLGVGFLVMSWLGYVGLLLFFKAGQIGMPQGDHGLLAKLLFFLPSLLFWPASVGKESWMLLTLGLATFGAALLVGPVLRIWGLLPAAAGLVGAGWVRPHMALLFACALCAGVVLRRSEGTARPGRQMLVGGLAVVVVFTMGARTEAEFGVSTVSTDGTADLSDVALSRSAQGGSEFEAKPVTNPLQLPVAFLSVAVRPFPFEANSPVQLLSSLEGVALLVIAYRRRPSLRELSRNAVTVMALVYCIGFVVAFSNIANFGILARQRVQLLPLLLFLFVAQRRNSAEVCPLVPVRTRAVGHPAAL